MQRRGGTGRTGMKTREEDFVEHLFIASTHAYILIFTNKGRVYWLKVYEIPDVSAAGRGKHIGNLIGLQPGETVRTMLAVRNLEEENKYIFFATRNGLVKKSELREFMHVRSNGINAINIEEGDELVAARITNGNQIVFIASHEGMAVRFDENHVRSMGRAAYGVNGINLDEGDYVVGMTVTPKPGEAPVGGIAHVGTDAFVRPSERSEAIRCCNSNRCPIRHRPCPRLRKLAQTRAPHRSHHPRGF
jgi:DNA gyrase subunit A